MANAALFPKRNALGLLFVLISLMELPLDGWLWDPTRIQRLCCRQKPQGRRRVISPQSPRKTVLRGVAVTALLCLTLAGCAGTAPEDPAAPEEPGEARATVLLDFRLPREPEDNVWFDVQAVAPGNVVQQGAVGTSTGGFLGAATDPSWSYEVEGDMNQEEPQRVGPYPYMRFEDVPNGTWLVEVERRPSDAVAPSEPSCLFVRFSAPDGTLRMGEAAHVSAPGLSHGLLAVDYRTGAVQVTRYAGDDCADA